MTREEAVKAVTRMMSAYTSFVPSEESLLVLAAVLMQFPMETATAAASPIHGAPKKYKDYPLNAGQLAEWCQNEARHLYEAARLERERLPAPMLPQPSEEERLRVQARLQQFLSARPGSKCDTRRSWFDSLSVADARAFLERGAA